MTTQLADVLQPKSFVPPPDSIPDIDSSSIPYISLKLPDDARDKIILWKNKNLPVFIKFLASPTPITKCKSCFDSGLLWLQFTIGGPYRDYPNTQPEGSTIQNIDGYWYLVENTYYPCPECSKLNLSDRSLTKSGLLPNEYKYKLEFIRGHEGKTMAYQTGVEIIKLEPNPKGLYLFYGNYGVGKSGILLSIVSHYASNKIKAKYIRAVDYLDMVRSTEGNINPGQKVRDDLNKFKLLAIDEIGRGSDTEFALGEIFTLMDDRYRRRNDLCTLIATNNNPTELWPYLQSRLKKAETVFVGGKDLRN